MEQELPKTGTSKCHWSLKEMKGVKAVGPDDTPVEVWKHQRDVAVELWTRLVNMMLEKDWRMEEKCAAADFHESGRRAQMWQLQGINLMIYEILKRIVEARQRAEASVCRYQYGFFPRKRTTDAVFLLRLLIENRHVCGCGAQSESGIKSEHLLLLW